MAVSAKGNPFHGQYTGPAEIADGKTPVSGRGIGGVVGHLMVLVETDSFIESKKKKRPVHTQRQRAELLASLLPVDSVIMLPVMQDADRDYSHIVHTIRPAVIAMTKGDRQQSRKELMAHEVGAKTHIIEHLSSFSSSQLITYASIFRN